MKRRAALLDVHDDFAVAVATVLPKPFNRSLFVKRIGSNVFPRLAKTMVAGALHMFVNPIEEILKLVLGCGQGGYCVGPLDGL